MWTYFQSRDNVSILGLTARKVFGRSDRPLFSWRRRGYSHHDNGASTVNDVHPVLGYEAKPCTVSCVET